MTIMERPTVKATGDVGEFVIEARLDALNRALAENGVDASRIISIFRLAEQPIANGAPARFHVLYRRG